MEIPAHKSAIRSSLALGCVLITGLAGFTGCGRTPPSCHSEPFAVILSAAKDLALAAQGKLREESRSDCFQRSARFLVVPIRSGLLGMTGEASVSASCYPVLLTHLPPTTYHLPDSNSLCFQ